MATSTARQAIPIVPDRAKLTAQIDALEAAGGDAESIAAMRTELARLRLPDDMVQPSPVTHATAILGSLQLKAIVRRFGDRMPKESRELVEAVAASLDRAVLA